MVSQALGNPAGSVPSGEFIAVPFTVIYDNDHYTSAPNLFTVPRAGIYRASISVVIDAVGSASGLQIWIVQSNNIAGGNSSPGFAANAIPLVCSADQVLQCAKADTIQFQFSQEDSVDYVVILGTVHIEQIR